MQVIDEVEKDISKTGTGKAVIKFGVFYQTPNSEWNIQTQSGI